MCAYSWPGASITSVKPMVFEAAANASSVVAQFRAAMSPPPRLVSFTSPAQVINTVASGTNGADGSDGKNALVRTREATDDECVNGGTAFEAGIDDDGNGALDAAEIDSSAAVCNGAASFVDGDSDGIDDRVALSGGSNCSSSGIEPSVAALLAGLTLALRRRRRA